MSQCPLAWIHSLLISRGEAQAILPYTKLLVPFLRETTKPTYNNPKLFTVVPCHGGRVCTTSWSRRPATNQRSGPEHPTRTMEASSAVSKKVVSAAYLAEDRSGVLVGISIACIILTTLLLAARIYAKRFQGGKFYTEDAFTVASYIVNLGMCAVGISECSPPT